MNLIGHVAVAVHQSPDPSPDYLVGCMLPDLAAMARVRLRPAAGGLGEGVAFHHASDAAFHSSDWFNRHNQALRDNLLAAGVDRGASRACAHAGLEMMLDGSLVADPLVERGAEVAFGRLSDAAMIAELRALVELDARDLWAERLGLIGRSLDVRSYASTDVVAERLRRMTNGRARIELRAEQVGVVAGALAAYRPKVAADADRVVTDVIAALGHRARTP